MKIDVIPVTAFQQNCSIIVCTETNKAAIVDPGGEVDRIKARLIELNVEPEKILITHAHIDHAGGTKDLADTLNLPIEGPEKEDQFWIDKLDDQSRMFQFPEAKPFVPTRWLKHDDTVTVGNLSFEVKHCPGHTPGHVIFINHQYKFIWVGDVLFKGSMGRTDFPRGDHQTLIDSIHANLLTLPDDYQFLSGHGEVSSIGYERNTNPYIGG
ncbi:MBL fold metallo-hydrolase [uncultured Psychrosphaera sp.]|uniref:MBL fold metallo-hydrolase n=1 Tax=uncultured Psychrosphaera sp. TaxID=1403522 RepID=UPI00262D2BAE|nr:MBL fold metallo-hydrolase [uncultured Psychrosphaera sp.]